MLFQIGLQFVKCNSTLRYSCKNRTRIVNSHFTCSHVIEREGVFLVMSFVRQFAKAKEAEQRRNSNGQDETEDISTPMRTASASVRSVNGLRYNETSLGAFDFQVVQQAACK